MTYHFKNATIYPGAGFSYLSEADKLNGIDLRTIVLLRADAYREQGVTGWSDWKNVGSPASKFALTVERRHGVLKASSRERLKFFSRPIFDIPKDA